MKRNWPARIALCGGWMILALIGAWAFGVDLPPERGEEAGWLFMVTVPIGLYMLMCPAFDSEGDA